MLHREAEGAVRRFYHRQSAYFPASNRTREELPGQVVMIRPAVLGNSDMSVADVFGPMSRIQTYKRPQTGQNRISNENWSSGNHLAWRNNPRQGAIRCVYLLKSSTELGPMAERRSLPLIIGHSRVLIWHFLPSFSDLCQHENRRNDSTRYGAETRNCALAKFSEWRKDLFCSRSRLMLCLRGCYRVCFQCQFGNFQQLRDLFRASIWTARSI